MKISQYIGLLCVAGMVMTGCAKAENGSAKAESGSAKAAIGTAADSTETAAEAVAETAEAAEKAEMLSEGYGWRVYRLYTGESGCSEMCRIYIEDACTQERRLLIATHGKGQEGTRLSIKSHNRLAYGEDDVTFKDSATYEPGFITAIEQATVVSPSKIVLCGVPDCRNIYSYLYDLPSGTAVHIEAYSGFAGTVQQDGQTYLRFVASDYTEDGRQERCYVYDLEGNFVRKEVQK